MAATVTYMGADNKVTTDMAAERALYLKMFSGEVLTAFPEFTSFIDKVKVRTLKSGKSAQFPLVGRMPAAVYHTPGNELLGQEAPLSEVTISIDRLLVSHLFVDGLDEKLAHFDARSELSRNMARRLAQTYDQHVARNVILAAQQSALITGDTTMGGLVITDADLGSGVAATKMAGWMDAFNTARTNFDDKWVNDGTIWCALKPADFYFLVQQAMASGYSLMDTRIGGAGDIAGGNLPRVLGIELVSFTGLPTGNESGDAFHGVDCRNTSGLIWTKGAVGTVKAADIAVETEYKVNYQGTLVVAKSAMGHGPLQGECAIHLRTAAPV